MKLSVYGLCNPVRKLVRYLRGVRDTWRMMKERERQFKARQRK